MYSAGVKQNLVDQAVIVCDTFHVIMHANIIFDETRRVEWHTRTLDSRITNAFMKGLNSVFSAVKRKARGFRSVDHLIALRYFTAAHLNIPATH